MDGILNINKPQGLTSFQVVAAVKRITGEKHCGHAGTLDPIATGVLPVCLGQATRVIEFLFNDTKTYRAQVELGVTTDSYDSTGKVLREADACGVTRDMVERALDGFRGSILQTPPMYSAVKYHGQPLYKLARSGIEVERKSRTAQIYSLEIQDWQPPVVTLDVVCGKGTYIRALANDLGTVLGCGANMKGLIRRRVGPFNIEDALTLPRLEEVFREGDGEKQLYAVDFALMSYSAIVVNKAQQCSLHHGSAISLEAGGEAEKTDVSQAVRSRAYTEDGEFVGMIKYDHETLQWRPEKIFLKNCCERVVEIDSTPISI